MTTKKTRLTFVMALLCLNFAHAQDKHSSKNEHLASMELRNNTMCLVITDKDDQL